MKFPSRAEVDAIKNEYPVGTEIELIFMDDKQAPEPGTRGIVRHVDDAGQVHVAWATGSTLAIIPGTDCCIKVDKDEEMER